MTFLFVSCMTMRKVRVSSSFHTDLTFVALVNVNVHILPYLDDKPSFAPHPNIKTTKLGARGVRVD